MVLFIIFPPFLINDTVSTDMSQTKLSFTTMGTPDWDAKEAIRAAIRYGYQGIDLRISDFKGELRLSSSNREISQIREMLSAENIQLAGLLCYNEVGGRDKESWEKMKISILKHLEIALKLNSPSIRIFGGNPHKDMPFSEYVKHFADTINSILESVEDDIYILIQNHRGSFTATEAVNLINQTNNPRFRLVFSPDHSLMMGEHLPDVYKLIKPLTYQLYIADVKPADTTQTNKERDYIAILPGRGIVPIRETYDAMGGKSFTGFVSFKWEKIWQEYLEGPEIALPYFIRYWNRITAK